MDKDAADRISACPYHVSGNNRGSLILAGALGLGEKETAFLVAANFFTSGIAILIQVIGIGKLEDPNIPLFWVLLLHL